MGFRFRRSVKIAPGIRINFNAKSTSVRIGPRGLGFTVSSTGRKHVSAGIPGTGLSFTEQVAPAKRTRPAQREAIAQPIDLIEPERKSPSGISIFVTIVAILFGVAWCSGRGPASNLQVDAPSQSTNVETTPLSSPTAPAENLAIAGPSEPSAAAATIILFTTAGVRLREGPSTDTGAILTVPAGSEVKSSGTDGQWHRVVYNSRTGWIRGDYLTDERPVQRKNTALTAPKIIAPAQPRAGQAVRGPYTGRCDCPYDRMRNGRLCGGRSAYSRPGGRSPVCYF